MATEREFRDYQAAVKRLETEISMLRRFAVDMPIIPLDVRSKREHCRIWYGKGSKK